MDQEVDYIKCKYDRLIPGSELRPYPKNRNSHSKEQIKRLAKLLQYQGIRAPIIVSTLSGCIVKGHGTLEAIKYNRWALCPIVEQSFQDEEQEYLFVQSDNAIAGWSSLDLSGISADIGEIGPFDIELLGLKDFTVDVSERLEDTNVVKAKDTSVALGDLYEIGNHRLLCGDCTDMTNIVRILGSEKYDVFFGDPPYGIEFSQLFAGVRSLGAKQVSTLWMDDDLGSSRLASRFSERFQRYLVYAWTFGIGGSSGSPLYHKHSLVGLYDECFERYVNLKDGYGSFVLTRLERSANQETYGLNQAKSVSFLEGLLTHFSQSGDLVLDVFGGVGSMIVASERVGRRCLTVEIDPLRCQTILNRLQAECGLKGVKV